MKKNNCCDGCKYYKSMNNIGPPLKACHYCYNTEISRGCPPEECDKKERRGRGGVRKAPLPIAPRRKRTQGLIQAIRPEGEEK
jgi:hypothetical protein